MKKFKSNEEVQIDPDLFNKNKPLFTTLKNTKDKKSKKEEKQKERQDDSNLYNWIKVIGQGTFGVVYKCERKKDKKKVAIKKVY